MRRPGSGQDLVLLSMPVFLAFLYPNKGAKSSKLSKSRGRHIQPKGFMKQSTRQPAFPIQVPLSAADPILLSRLPTGAVSLRLAL